MLFGSLSRIGASLIRSASPKIPQKSALLRSENFVTKVFFGGQGTKRSKSFRIYEYFNEATTENTCSKIWFKFECFGYIDNPHRIEKFIEEQTRNLINKYEYVDFIVGRNGDFDQYAASSVLRTRKNYRDDNSSLILVLPYPTAEYLQNEEYFHNYYTDVEISSNASKAHPKAAIQIRNREMIDRADLVICYIEHNKGGAWQTMQYAIQQGKKIINLALQE